MHKQVRETLMREDDAPLAANPRVTPGALRELHAELHSWAVSCSHGNRDQALEVLQMTYLALMEGRALYQGDATLRTFLFAVVRNVARSLRRKLWLRSHLDALWSVAPPAVESSTEADADESQRVRAALRALAGRQREVLELVYYRELTIEQAASVMGIRVGSARTHYARGKEALRRRLA
jgi:RNA polymerase sigma-70 factor, ECF subfamily